MTDQLTADVERWLAEQVRTTWPGKSGDCCDAGERADMARWFAGQIRAFEAWRGKQSIVHVLSVARTDGEAAVCPVTASEPPNSTPTAQGTNRATGGVVPKGTHVVFGERGCDVVNTLPEAAGAARRGNAHDNPELWWTNDGFAWVHWRDALRRMGPPKPGTHESDLPDAAAFTWSSEATLPGQHEIHGKGGSREFNIARRWSTANRQENT